jgi:hypothetical protein
MNAWRLKINERKNNAMFGGFTKQFTKPAFSTSVGLSVSPHGTFRLPMESF